jgi:PST family polysaccharide transporter
VRFGLPVVLSGLVAEAVLNVDYIVVGRMLGPVVLGVYLLAFNLSTWPVSAVIAAVGRVALAAFARLRAEPERMAAAYDRSIGAIVSAILPVAIVLGVLAPEVISFLYGDRWLSAATPLRFLLGLALARVAIQVTFDFLMANDRPRTMLKILGAWLCALVPGLAIGAALGGIAGVGIGHLLVAFGITVPLLLRAVRKLGVEPARLAQTLRRPALAGAAALCIMLSANHVISGTMARLVLSGCVGGATYFAVLVPANPLVGWIRDRRASWSSVP